MATRQQISAMDPAADTAVSGVALMLCGLGGLLLLSAP